MEDPKRRHTEVRNNKANLRNIINVDHNRNIKEKLLSTVDERVISGATAAYFATLEKSEPPVITSKKPKHTKLAPSGICSNLENEQGLVTDHMINLYGTLLNLWRDVYKAWVVDPLFINLLANKGFTDPNVSQLAKNIFLTGEGGCLVLPDRIILPYNYKGRHWIVAVVNTVFREITWYDSFKDFARIEDKMAFARDSVLFVYSKILELMSFLYTIKGSHDLEMRKMWDLQEGTVTECQGLNLRCGIYAMAITKICFLSKQSGQRNIRLFDDIENIRLNIHSEIAATHICTEENYGTLYDGDTTCPSGMIITKVIGNETEDTPFVKKSMLLKRIHGVLAERTEMNFVLGEDYAEMVTSQCSRLYLEAATNFPIKRVELLPRALSNCRMSMEFAISQTSELMDKFGRLCNELTTHGPPKTLVFRPTETGPRSGSNQTYTFLTMCCITATALRVVLQEKMFKNTNLTKINISQLILEIPHIEEYTEIFNVDVGSFSKFGCYTLAKVIHKKLIEDDPEIKVYTAIREIVDTITIMDTVCLFLHTGMIANSSPDVFVLRNATPCMVYDHSVVPEFYAIEKDEIYIYPDAISEYLIVHYFSPYTQPNKKKKTH